METAIYVLTPQGARTALRLAPFVGGRIYAAAALREYNLSWESALWTTPEDGPADGPEEKTSPDEPLGETECAHVPLPAGGALPVHWFTSLPQLVGETFHAHTRHVFITAAGIAVRSIAPLLRSKLTDPAVLVVDQKGSFVVGLLSGHEGGANSFALHVAEILGATPVITTATDVEGLPAVDVLALERGLAIANPGAIKRVSGALVAGQPVALYDAYNRLGLRGGRWEGLFLHRPATSRGESPGEGTFPAGAITPGSLSSEAPPRPLRPASDVPPPADTSPQGGPRAESVPCILVTHEAVVNPQQHPCLVLHPPVLFVGVGCKRNTRAEDILEVLHTLLHARGLALASLVCLASLDAQKNAPGLVVAAAKLGVPLRLFSAEVLQTMPVTAPSPKAAQTLGVQGVCEPAALLAAGESARLLVPKTTGNGIAMAVAGRF